MDDVLDMTVDESREPRCSKDITRENIKSELIPDDLLQSYMLAVKKVEQACTHITGSSIDLSPPQNLLPNRDFGYWFNLSNKAVPFVFHKARLENLHPNAKFEMETEKRLALLKKTYLITAYLDRIIKHLEQEENEVLPYCVKMLRHLHKLLIWLLKDIEGYCMSSTPQNLPLTESKITDLEKKVDEVSQLQLTVIKITLSEVDLLCNILGFQEFFSKKLNAVHDLEILHRSTLNLIEDIMEDNIDELVNNDSHQSEENIVTSLVLLGFTQEKSEQIANSIPPHYHHMQSPLYWATEYLDLVYSTHPLLNMIPNFSGYANVEMSQWVEASAQQRAPNDNNIIHLKYQMIKLNNNDITVTSETISEMFRLDRHTLLFHGAKNANSVHNILRRGILLTYGKNNQDFSHGSGYYMGDQFETAKEWANMRRNSPSAVIVYRIPDNLLVYGDKAGLDLNEPQHDWSKVIRHHRTGYEVENGGPNVTQRTFIKGPICSNGRIIQNNWDAACIRRLFQGSSLQQYCIRSQKFATTISPLVVGVVIYVVVVD